jgi:ParB family transcriptional regulator, chromosome partitioning protein
MQKSGNNWIVSPAEIEIEDGFNARYNYGDIEELSNSIIANGLKIPLKGVKKQGEEKFILTDGHRRFKAICLAYEKGHTDIKIALSPEAKQSNEERTLAMITYNSGKPFEMLEESDIYQRLINYGWTVAEIAKRVGKSGQYIRDCILLMTASKVLKNQIVKGLISSTTVLEMIKKDGGNIGAIEDKVQTAIDSNEGKKVSNKHILPKKPTNKDVFNTVLEVENRELSNVLKIFLEYQDGTISKAKFLIGAGTVKVH